MTAKRGCEECEKLRAEISRMRKTLRRVLSWLRRHEVEIVGTRCGATTCGFRCSEPMVNPKTKTITERLEFRLAPVLRDPEQVDPQVAE